MDVTVSHHSTQVVLGPIVRADGTGRQGQGGAAGSLPLEAASERLQTLLKVRAGGGGRGLLQTGCYRDVSTARPYASQIVCVGIGTVAGGRFSSQLALMASAAGKDWLKVAS